MKPRERNRLNTRSWPFFGWFWSRSTELSHLNITTFLGTISHGSHHTVILGAAVFNVAETLSVKLVNKSLRFWFIDVKQPSSAHHPGWPTTAVRPSLDRDRNHRRRQSQDGMRSIVDPRVYSRRKLQALVNQSINCAVVLMYLPTCTSNRVVVFIVSSFVVLCLSCFIFFINLFFYISQN